MNKENNKSAAGLRRSAIAERLRLREEWSELKGTDSQQDKVKKKILVKKQNNVKSVKTAAVAKNVTDLNTWRKPSSRNMQQTEDVLCGVVALVEVGSESKALPLRAALTALGASVLPAWNPLVTHLIWTEGGCRATRAKGRALACRLVSPLWVEACAAALRRLPEQAFPAAARASDLPSPRTMCRQLKKAEMENISIMNLLFDSNEENQKQLRLRISSETEQDTSADTSRDTSKDTSRDTSNNTSVSVESRVNTAPRRALPLTESMSPAPQAKSRRKLFTQKEADASKENVQEEEEVTTMPKPRKPSYKPAAKRAQPKPARERARVDRRELARAERLATRLVARCTQATTSTQSTHTNVHRIVLTGMSRSERHVVSQAVRALKGRLQPAVDRRTTHVLLGSFLHDQDYNKTTMTGVSPLTPNEQQTSVPPKARTVAALEGAARGCRVLAARWALDSREGGKWLSSSGYEVTHLRKIAQNARVERSALGKLHSEYAYDVFCGMRVRVGRDADNREGAIKLLRLCGAIVQDETENKEQNGGRLCPPTSVPDGPSQYYVTQYPDVEFDVRLGQKVGDVSTKWVFDSVAAGRMRTTRRYVISHTQSDDELFIQLASLGC